MKRSTIFSTAKRALAVAVVGGLVMAGSTACSSTGGAEHQNSGDQGQTGQATTPRMTIAVVTHSPTGDVFWDLVRKGAEAAAAKDNVELTWAGDEDAAKQATLLQNAVDQGVDGIAVTLAKPDAMSAGMAAAKQAGIPTVALNAGLDTWKDLGALAFFGLDIPASGTLSGEELARSGAKNAICVIQEQGSVVLDSLCQGATEAFTTGTMQTLYVNGADNSSVQSTLTAAMQADPTIDGVVTLNAPIGVTAVASAKSAGVQAKVTTLNMTQDLIPLIKDGSVIAAIDQQGWLQGYEAVDALWLNKTNANILGSGQPVLTGPTLVTKDNIDTIAPLVEAGTR